MGQHYTTERGISIRIVPIPLLLDKVRAAYPDLPNPTYTEQVAGGATQDVEITEDMAASWAKEDPDGWAPHAAKWAAYQAAQAARNEQANDAIWKAIVTKSIVADLPDSDDWVLDQQDLGIDVPESPRERRAHYIWTEVIGGTHDIIRITAMANGADLTEEALVTAEASFRGTIQEKTTERLAAQAGTVGVGG